MRHTCTLFTLFLFCGTGVMAADREKVYADQLDCATLKVLKSEAADAEQFQAVLDDAADDCVTAQGMASIHKGFKRYEDRNPETVRMEMEERKGYLIDGVLHRIETCRRSGMANGVATRSCNDFMNVNRNW
jgi:hypothetical protein